MKCVLSFKIDVMLAGAGWGQVCAFLKKTKEFRVSGMDQGVSLITVFWFVCNEMSLAKSSSSGIKHDSQASS